MASLTGLLWGLAAVLMLAGALLVLLAGLGIVRFPDLYLRMSATTKAAALGLSLVLIGVALMAGTWGVSLRVLAILLFILLTAPIAGHAIGQAAYFSGVPLWKGTVVDELDRQPAAQKREGARS